MKKTGINALKIFKRGALRDEKCIYAQEAYKNVFMAYRRGYLEISFFYMPRYCTTEGDMWIRND